MNKVYPSKRDGWLVFLLWLAALVMIFAGVALARTPVPLLPRLCMSALPALLAAFVLWTLYGTYYLFTQEQLVIRSGPFRWTIALKDIVEVSPTRNPLSSPACSLDRLVIRYGPNNNSIMISPGDKPGFLQDLAARVPGLLLRNGTCLTFDAGSIELPGQLPEGSP